MLSMSIFLNNGRVWYLYGTFHRFAANVNIVQIYIAYRSHLFLFLNFDMLRSKCIAE